MNSIVLVFAAALAAAQAGFLSNQGLLAYSGLPDSRTTFLQGPSSTAQIVGNDGLGIIGHAPGGSITATENLGGAAVAYQGAPIIAERAALIGHQAYAAPALIGHQAYAAPALIGHQAYAAPILARQGFVNAYAAGSGIEGQWVPDFTERLFDDGSYKGEIY